jgi:hypothetical protein
VQPPAAPAAAATPAAVRQPAGPDPEPAPIGGSSTAGLLQPRTLAASPGLGPSLGLALVGAALLLAGGRGPECTFAPSSAARSAAPRATPEAMI